MATKKASSSNGKSLSLKVSPKGGVALYGLRRFPIVFYADEWNTFFDKKDAIQAFIAKNRKQLKEKGDTEETGGGTAI